MIFKFKLNFIICLLLVLFFHATSASALEHRGNATLGYTHYVHEALYPDQKDGSMSFSIEPELYFELKDDLSFTLRPFFRYDSADSERTHFDLREAMLLYAKDTY
ncbi:MAG: hypothetical protein KAR06_06785, partial [Deltaproteobacteria bacterium]|nr:hypothetical protein [Deltaproteobacteria bacterium]